MNNLNTYNLAAHFNFSEGSYDNLIDGLVPDDTCLKFDLDICGYSNVDRYFLIDEILFIGIKDLIKGWGYVTLETNFILNEVLLDMISRFIKKNNKTITRTDITGNVFKLEFDEIFLIWR